MTMLLVILLIHLSVCFLVHRIIHLFVLHTLVLYDETKGAGWEYGWTCARRVGKNH